MLDFENRSIYWTAVDIANHFGLDKKSFTERVAWVKENVLKLESFMDEADSPYEYRKAVKALRIYEQGKMPAHMVYLDASNQALQLYAILTADKKTASTCNLANGEHMADAYQLLANGINNILGTSLTRANCKKALMTTMYGKEDGTEEILQHLYPRGFNEDDLVRDHGCNVEQLQSAFRAALIDIAPKAIVAMDAIQALNNENVGTYYWTLPDGFNVKYDVKVDKEVRFEDWTESGVKIEIDDVIEVYEPSESNRGMSPNVIHSVDGYVARELIRRMTAEGKFITTIHDAFACLPEDCDFMRETYQDIFVELLNSDLLNNILTQIGKTQIGISKTNDLTEEDIRTSLYFLG